MKSNYVKSHNKRQRENLDDGARTFRRVPQREPKQGDTGWSNTVCLWTPRTDDTRTWKHKHIRIFLYLYFYQKYLSSLGQNTFFKNQKNSGQINQTGPLINSGLCPHLMVLPCSSEIPAICISLQVLPTLSLEGKVRHFVSHGKYTFWAASSLNEPESVLLLIPTQHL